MKTLLRIITTLFTASWHIFVFLLEVAGSTSSSSSEKNTYEGNDPLLDDPLRWEGMMYGYEKEQLRNLGYTAAPHPDDR